MSDTMTPEQDVVLGPCCVCERAGATVIVMLQKRAPVEGHGWGCVICNLGPDGACAVACEGCAAAPGFPQTLRFACRGYPSVDGRIPVAELAGEHKHDAEHHRQYELAEVDDGCCHLCGGAGVLEGECECQVIEDICCCLHPKAPICPECHGGG